MSQKYNIKYAVIRRKFFNPYLWPHSMISYYQCTTPLHQRSLNSYSLSNSILLAHPKHNSSLFVPTSPSSQSPRERLETIHDLGHHFVVLWETIRKSHRTHIKLNLARYDSVLYTHYFLLNGASLCNLFKN